MKYEMHAIFSGDGKRILIRKWRPLSQIESMNAQNRLKIMTAVILVYNEQLSSIPKSKLYHLCRLAAQLINQAFTEYGHVQYNVHCASYGQDPNSGHGDSLDAQTTAANLVPRIALSPQFLHELLHSTHFAMFNEFTSIASQTVDDVH